jgi:hypothetical protein
MKYAIWFLLFNLEEIKAAVVYSKLLILNLHSYFAHIILNSQDIACCKQVLTRTRT